LRFGHEIEGDGNRSLPPLLTLPAGTAWELFCHLLLIRLIILPLQFR
jgi:hypothetical protein